MGGISTTSQEEHGLVADGEATSHGNDVPKVLRTVPDTLGLVLKSEQVLPLAVSKGPFLWFFCWESKTSWQLSWSPAARVSKVWRYMTGLYTELGRLLLVEKIFLAILSPTICLCLWVKISVP